MKYNEAQVEEIMYSALKNYLESIISGKIYKSECRPLDSKEEDAVVGVSAIDAEQIQQGRARVNIYVRDIDNRTGNLVPNKERLTELSNCDEYIIDTLNSEACEFDWILAKATRTYKNQQADEHFVSVVIDFKTITI